MTPKFCSMDFIKNLLKIIVFTFGFISFLEVNGVNFMKHQCNAGRKNNKRLLT